MSVSAMALAMYHSRSKYTTRLVLIAIANFDGEYGAYPSHDTIGRLAGGVNRRTVQRSIDELIQLGELTEIERKGQTNLYRVVIKCPQDCDGTTAHRRIVTATQGGGLQTAGGVQTATRGGVQTAGDAVSRPPEPLTNHNLNHKKADNDYTPSDEFLKQLAEKYPNVDLQEVYESMMDYCASHGKTYKDWDAAYRNFVRKQYQWSDKAKQETNKAETRRWLDKEHEHTKQLMSEYEELAKTAAPPPKCIHGNSVVSCRDCLRG